MPSPTLAAPRRGSIAAPGPQATVALLRSPEGAPCASTRAPRAKGDQLCRCQDGAFWTCWGAPRSFEKLKSIAVASATDAAVARSAACLYCQGRCASKRRQQAKQASKTSAAVAHAGAVCLHCEEEVGCASTRTVGGRRRLTWLGCRTHDKDTTHACVAGSACSVRLSAGSSMKHSTPRLVSAKTCVVEGSRAASST